MFKLKGKRCERCPQSYHIEVHHKHYRTFKREGLRDLEVLCLTCHNRADEDRRVKQVEEFAAIRRENDRRAFERAYETWREKKYGAYEATFMWDEFLEWVEIKDWENHF